MSEVGKSQGNGRECIKFRNSSWAGRKPSEGAKKTKKCARQQDSHPTRNVRSAAKFRTGKSEENRRVGREHHPGRTGMAEEGRNTNTKSTGQVLDSKVRRNVKGRPDRNQKDKSQEGQCSGVWEDQIGVGELFGIPEESVQGHRKTRESEENGPRAGRSEVWKNRISAP